MTSPQIQTRGKWQYTTHEGSELKRRTGTTEWEVIDSPPSGSAPLELKLVREFQLPGEPHHWSLFLAYENQSGTVFQVRGDAVDMHFAHLENEDVLRLEGYNDSYIIARPTEQQARRVQHWANHEEPPSARNQAAVRENCQGWSIRVMRRLVAEGIIEGKWVDTAQSLQEPVQ